MVPARLPQCVEIYRHLEYRPWIFLSRSFDFRGCFREAENLLQKFVVHRENDQESCSKTAGSWKSLGIQALNGDYTKSQHHLFYGLKEPRYKTTEIADLCPKIMDLVSVLTDLSVCHRVRLMLLEPGARIRVHSDAPNSNVGFSLNIALNMPSKCEFWVDLNSDGTRHAFSKKLPVKDGSIFIFNNATYHCVNNNSPKPRIHLIVNGPIRFTDKQILDLARRQNKTSSYENLMTKLETKYSRLNKKIRPLFTATV